VLDEEPDGNEPGPAEPARAGEGSGKSLTPSGAWDDDRGPGTPTHGPAVVRATRRPGP
jgi:hypothetical protein